MGEDIKIKDVQIENDGTLLQIDCDAGRLFVKMRDVYKALNNYAYLKHDQTMLKMGFEPEDPDNYENPNLIK